MVAVGRMFRSNSSPLSSQSPAADTAAPAPAPPPQARGPAAPLTAGPQPPSPQDTLHALAPHIGTAPLFAAAAALTPAQRLALAPLQNDGAVCQRLRDLLVKVQGDGGAAGATALLQAVAAPDAAARVRCLHVLSRLWPGWQRGQGLLDLLAALAPSGPQALTLTWDGLTELEPQAAGLKISFRALERAQVALLGLLTAPLQPNALLRPSVPKLINLPRHQADALVQLLYACPPAHRQALSHLLPQVQERDTPADTDWLVALQSLSVADWDSLMEALNCARRSTYSHGAMSLRELARAVLQVGSLGGTQATRFARLVDDARFYMHAAVVNCLCHHWMALVERGQAPTLEPRTVATLECLDWDDAANLRSDNLLVERFFAPELTDPAAYMDGLRAHRTAGQSPGTLRAMLAVPRDHMHLAALTNQTDAPLLRRVEALGPAAQALAPWIRQHGPTLPTVRRILDIAERVPQSHLPALAQRMAAGPSGALWLDSVAGDCSDAALIRLSQCASLRLPRKAAWLQLAACVLPDLANAPRWPANFEALVREEEDANTLAYSLDFMRSLPSPAHRQVWTETAPQGWCNWPLAHGDLAAQAAHVIPARRYAAALQCLDNLQPWTPPSTAALLQLTDLPAAEQRDGLLALSLFGTPATTERQTLARLIFAGLDQRQSSEMITHLHTLHAPNAERPSDEALTAMLLPLVAPERVKLLRILARPAVGSWAQRTALLARMRNSERESTAALLWALHSEQNSEEDAAQWQSLLSRLRPHTAWGMLRDITSVLQACPTPPDLQGVWDLLQTFPSARSRHDACDDLYIYETTDRVMAQLAQRASATRAAGGLMGDPARDATPLIDQAWRDNENVMLTEHRDAVGRAILALRARMPQPSFEVIDAFLALNLPPKARDLVDRMQALQDTLDITPTCRVPALHVLTWVLLAIQNWRDTAGDEATATGRENMLHTLTNNLVSCWEGRSYRPEPVCLVGQCERMVMALNGYDPDVQLVLVTPRDLVNGLAGPLQAQRGDGDAAVDAAELEAFSARCHVLATELFAGNVALVAECDALARAARVYLQA